MEKQYFLNISRVNLVYFYKTGLIKPSCYFDKWNEDIQSKYNNSLLFFSEKKIRDSECCLEIVFNKDEKKELQEKNQDFFLYKKPLPISRIRNIYVPKNKSNETVFNIEAADGFIPEDSIKELESDNEEIKLPDFDFSKNENNWENKISLYDKIMGGFALMKVATSDNFKEYSDNYFKYLSYLNKSVEKSSNIIESSFNEKNLQTITITDDIPNSKIVYDSVSFKTVEQSNHRKQKIKKDRFTGNIEIEKIEDKGTYILAVLSEYGNDIGKSFKIQDFISNVISNRFRKDILEKLCLTFGINQGYKSFRNYYQIENNTLEVKFRLNSELDYTIIESIYQYIFNGKTDNFSFSYISSWCPKYRNNIDKKKYDIVKYFDKEVILNKKVIVGSQEYLLQILENFTNIKIFDDIKSKIKTTLDKIFTDFDNLREEENEANKNQIKELNRNIVQLENELKTVKSELKNYKLQDDSFVKELDNEKEEQTLITLKSEPDYLNNRIKTLKRIKAITVLKPIAKYVGVNEYKDYKSKEVDKLRELIIEKEKNALK